MSGLHSVEAQTVGSQLATHLAKASAILMLSAAGSTGGALIRCTARG